MGPRFLVAAVAMPVLMGLSCGDTSSAIDRTRPSGGGADSGSDAPAGTGGAGEATGGAATSSGGMGATGGHSLGGGSGGNAPAATGGASVDGSAGDGGRKADASRSDADATHDGHPDAADAPSDGSAHGDACRGFDSTACASASNCRWHFHADDPNGLPPTDGCYSACTSRDTCAPGAGCEYVWVPSRCDAACPTCSGSPELSCIPLDALPTECRNAMDACSSATTRVCMLRHPNPCYCGEICDESSVRLCIVAPTGTLYTVVASEFEEAILDAGWTHSVEKYLPSDLSAADEARCAAALRLSPICP